MPFIPLSSNDIKTILMGRRQMSTEYKQKIKEITSKYSDKSKAVEPNKIELNEKPKQIEKEKAKATSVEADKIELNEKPKHTEERTDVSLGDRKKLELALEKYAEHLEQERKKMMHEATIKFVNEQIKVEAREAKAIKKDPAKYHISSLKSLRNSVKTKKSYNFLENTDQLYSLYRNELNAFKLAEKYDAYLAQHAEDNTLLRKQRNVNKMLALLKNKGTKGELFRIFENIKPTLEERRGQSRFWKVIDRLFSRKFGVNGASLARSIHSQFHKIHKRDIKIQKEEQKKNFGKSK